MPLEGSQRVNYQFQNAKVIFLRNLFFPSTIFSFSNLNHDLYRKGCTDTQSCDCGHIIEDSKHFCLICPLYNNPRRDMLNEVQMHSQARSTPQLLLNGNHCLNEGS